jgi:hypothetical protein
VYLDGQTKSAVVRRAQSGVVRVKAGSQRVVTEPPLAAGSTLRAATGLRRTARSQRLSCPDGRSAHGRVEGGLWLRCDVVVGGGRNIGYRRCWEAGPFDESRAALVVVAVGLLELDSTIQ